MGRDREGCVGGAVEAQAQLYVARARLEPRRQPCDERDDQAALGGGAGGRGSGGVSGARSEYWDALAFAAGALPFLSLSSPVCSDCIKIGRASCRERVCQYV